MPTLSYCGHPVEIDDFTMSFKQLRVEIYSYVSKHFPELGELSADDYQQKWDAAFEEIVDIAVKYFEENSIVDYPRDKIKSELQGKCYRQFKKICARIDADVKAYQQQASQASGQTVKNMQNNGTSAGGQLAMGAAMLLLSSYGKSSTISTALKREGDNIRAEFKALKQKVSVYITRVMAAKMLDANYLDEMDAKTEAAVKELKDYSGEGGDEYDALIAKLLSINSIDWYVYETIFNENKEDYCIDPFAIEKIAEVHKIDISELIIDYFMNVSDRLGSEDDKELLDDIIEETAAYTPEESGDYAAFLADINGYMQDYRRLADYIQDSTQTQDFDRHMENGKKMRENRLELREAIIDDTPLHKRFCESLEEIHQVLSDLQSDLTANFYTLIFSLTIQDKDKMTLERAVHISDMMDSLPEKNEEQCQLYKEFSDIVSARAEQEWKEQLDAADHAKLVSLREAYINGNEPHYQLVHKYLPKETYEKMLETVINDLENKTLFRMTLGLSEKTQEELESLRDELRSLNYGETITNNFVNKVNQALYDKLHDKLLAEVNEKINAMDHAAVKQEYDGGQNGAFSVYQPDEYVSAEDIRKALQQRIDMFETEYLEKMCSGVENADLAAAQALLQQVQAASYREENKPKFLARIQQRITHCQEEELYQICQGRETLGLPELTAMAAKLDSIPYDHLSLKAELAAEVNTCIRKARSASYMQIATVLDGVGFKTITDKAVSFSDFEKASMEDMGITRDNALVQQNYGEKQLGSQETVIGLRKSERLFGLADDLRIMITEKRMMVSGSSLVFYGNVTSVRVVKKLLSTKIEIGLRQGDPITFGCSKEDAPKLCSALQQAIGSLG